MNLYTLEGESGGIRCWCIRMCKLLNTNEMLSRSHRAPMWLSQPFEYSTLNIGFVIKFFIYNRLWSSFVLSNNTHKAKVIYNQSSWPSVEQMCCSAVDSWVSWMILKEKAKKLVWEKPNVHQTQSQDLDKSTVRTRSILQVRPFGQAVIPELSHGCIQYASAPTATNKGQGFQITPLGAPSLPVPPASEGQYYSAPRPKEWLHCDGSRMQPSSEPTLQPPVLYLKRDTIIWSPLYVPLLSAASTVHHPW